jgi:hypothetical protein
MNTIKFRSTYENGVIRVPEEFRNEIASEVDVTVESVEPQNEKKRNLKFDAFGIDTRGWKFNRDEANARR